MLQARANPHKMTLVIPALGRLPTFVGSYATESALSDPREHQGGIEGAGTLTAQAGASLPAVLLDGLFDLRTQSPRYLEFLLRIQQNRYRAIVNQLHLHHFLEASGLAAQPQRLNARDEKLI
jgi:hypothetical protein